MHYFPNLALIYAHPARAFTMPASPRVRAQSESKVAKGGSKKKDESKLSVGVLLTVFFLFVVVGSAIFQFFKPSLF